MSYQQLPIKYMTALHNIINAAKKTPTGDLTKHNEMIRDAEEALNRLKQTKE